MLCLSNPALADVREVPQSKQQIQLSYAPLVKQTAPAVVNIYTKRTVARAVSPFFNDPFFSQLFGGGNFGGRMRKQVESALGSGVILESDGLVVTNSHVINDAEEITVVLADGREFDAELSLKDEASDLALLRIDTKGEALPAVKLKPSETLEVGDLVLAIGNPFGVGQTVTSGIVSAQGRSSLNINDFNFFIQTDAAINPGNSGGALVALDGGVVGINTAIYSRSGGSMGLGFAIPSEMVASVVAAEKAGQTSKAGIVRPWLGGGFQNLTSDIAGSLGLDRPHGSLITAIHPASPMQKAGLKVGDVITSVNGNIIQDSGELKFRMATVPLGQDADFEVIRPDQGSADQRLSVKVRAMQPPDDPPRNEAILTGSHIFNGISVGNMNPAVAVELGLVNEEEGVVVLSVPKRGRAVRVISPGDILLRINGQDIKQVQDVEKAMLLGKGSLDLTMKSNGRVQRIVLR